MDTLHQVLRTIKPATKSTDAVREPITVFREFLAHLDRVTRQPQRAPRTKAMLKATPRGKRR